MADAPFRQRPCAAEFRRRATRSHRPPASPRWQHRPRHLPTTFRMQPCFQRLHERHEGVDQGFVAERARPNRVTPFSASRAPQDDRLRLTASSSLKRYSRSGAAGPRSPLTCPLPCRPRHRRPRPVHSRRPHRAVAAAGGVRPLRPTRGACPGHDPRRRLRRRYGRVRSSAAFSIAASPCDQPGDAGAARLGRFGGGREDRLAFRLVKRHRSPACRR